MLRLKSTPRVFSASSMALGLCGLFVLFLAIWKAHAQSSSGSAQEAAAPVAFYSDANRPGIGKAAGTSDAHTPYSLPFGADPYLPSQASTDFAGFLRPSEIPSAAYCGHCHREVHAQWRQSAHANSFRTPWYRKNVDLLTTQKGIEFTRHCEGCHNPSALLTGTLTPGGPAARPGDDDGITCMTCHSIRSADGKRGTGSYRMGRPAVLVDAAGAPLSGLPSDAEILAHLDRHRQAVSRPFYKSSEFCAVCHKAAIPATMNDYKWLRTFTTYDEWQQSSWSAETPLTFYKKAAPTTCQNCHMPRNTLPGTAYAPSSHRWLGANTAIPATYGYAEQARLVEQYLQADKVTVDIFAVTPEHTAVQPGGSHFDPAALIAPLGSRPFHLLPGDWVRVDVVVRNKGIGHALVPELRDFYESWLEFEATDDSGQEVYRSGGLDSSHRVDPMARTYTTRIVSSKGAALDHHEIWQLYGKAYDATVAPGRSDVVRYRFRLPQGTGAVRLRAVLLYRRFNRNFSDWVFDDKASAPDRFPAVSLASSEFTIRPGENPVVGRAGTADDNTDQMRWNNYGIGMLDRQQFAEAADAFHHVTALDPAYEPGYVNIAIAEYMRGRYSEALRMLDKSASLDSKDARGQYYRGLCLRWSGLYDQAIAVLKPVAERFPRFRQVHQELGYLYMLQHRYNESRDEYETVLKIDPDDALAHRWLGPVYTALGNEPRAAQERALAAQTGTDTSAGWVLQRFWREHPDVVSEAMPSHTHSAGGQHDDADLARVLQLQNPPSYIWIER